MSLYFPDTSQINPDTGNIWADGDTYQSTNGVTYKWDATHGGWVALAQDIDAWTKAESDDRFIIKAGDSATGPILLQDEFGSPLYPTGVDQAAPKGYVDDEIDTAVTPVVDDIADLTLEVDKKVNKSTDTMSGALHLQNVDGTPQNIMAADQAVTKKYVDDEISNVNAGTNVLHYRGIIDATTKDPLPPIEEGDFYINDKTGTTTAAWGSQPIQAADRLFYQGSVWEILHVDADEYVNVDGDTMTGALLIDATTETLPFVVKGHAANDLFGVRHDDAVVDNNGPYALNEDGTPFTASQDSQLVTKGYSDDSFVHKVGGDSVDGPLDILGGRNVDPTTGVQSTVKVLNVDSGESSTLNLKWNGQTKAYLGDAQLTLTNDLKFNTGGKAIYAEGPDKNGFVINNGGVFYDGAYSNERHVATKKDVEEAVFDDISNPDSNKYVKRTGDDMSGDLSLEDSRLVFKNPTGNRTLIRANRDGGARPKALELPHNQGDGSAGGYDIHLTGNTANNSLRFTGGDTYMEIYAGGGAPQKVRFYTDVSMEDSKIVKLAEATEDTDAVPYGQIKTELQDKFEDLVSSASQGTYTFTSNSSPTTGQFFTTGASGFESDPTKISRLTFNEVDGANFRPDFLGLSVGDTVKVLQGTSIRQFRVRDVPYLVVDTYFVNCDSGKGDNFVLSEDYEIVFQKMGGTVNLDDYVKKSGDRMSGMLQIHQTSEAKLELKGNRNSLSNSAATVSFLNGSAAGEPGYLTYRSDGSGSPFFKFNENLDLNSKQIKSLSSINFDNVGTIKANDNQKMVIRNAGNDSVGNGNVQIERPPNSRRGFTIRGNDVTDNETDILWTYTNASGGDAVNYNGKMSGDNNIMNRQGIVDLVGELVAEEVNFVNYGTRTYRRSSDANHLGGLKNLAATGSQPIDSFTKLQISPQSASSPDSYPKFETGIPVDSFIKITKNTGEAIYRITSVAKSGVYYNFDVELVSSKGNQSAFTNDVLGFQISYPVIKSGTDNVFTGRNTFTTVIDTEDTYTQELYTELANYNLDMSEIPTVGFVLASEYKKSIAFGDYDIALSNNNPTDGQINFDAFTFNTRLKIAKTDKNGQKYPFELFFNPGEYISISQIRDGEEEVFLARISDATDSGSFVDIRTDTHTVKISSGFNSGVESHVAKSGKMDKSQAEFLIHEHATIPGYRPFRVRTSNYSGIAGIGSNNFHYWGGTTNNPTEIRFAETCVNGNKLSMNANINLPCDGTIFIATADNMNYDNDSGRNNPDPANNDFSVVQILKYTNLGFRNSDNAWTCTGVTQNFKSGGFNPNSNDLIYVKINPLY